jgi:hypothetical protein
MAKIIYAEKAKANGDAIDGVTAEYDGRTFAIAFYPGDTRVYAVRVAALKAWLAFEVNEDAKRRGRPLPEAVA